MRRAMRIGLFIGTLIGVSACAVLPGVDVAGAASTGVGTGLTLTPVHKETVAKASIFH